MNTRPVSPLKHGVSLLRGWVQADGSRRKQKPGKGVRGDAGTCGTPYTPRSVLSFFFFLISWDREVNANYPGCVCIVFHFPSRRLTDTILTLALQNMKLRKAK